MTASAQQQPTLHPRPTIPVIDFGPALARRPGARESIAAELRHALEHVGFFIMINHGVPPHLIDRTFAEARRFHDQPPDAKMALRMNEHNNGYMSMGRYAVWTSEVNTNDKPDLKAGVLQRSRKNSGSARWSRRPYNKPMHMKARCAAGDRRALSSAPEPQRDVCGQRRA